MTANGWRLMANCSIFWYVSMHTYIPSDILICKAVFLTCVSDIFCVVKSFLSYLHNYSADGWRLTAVRVANR